MSFVFRNDSSENRSFSEDIQTYENGYRSDGFPILENSDAVRRRCREMASGVHRCGWFKGCLRSCSCKQKESENACFLCGCFYNRIKTEPPMRLNIPPMDYQNKFNTNEEWNKVQDIRRPSTTVSRTTHMTS